MYRFTWDSSKAASNARKHGVTFEEARTVFADKCARFLEDPDFVNGEERYVLLGFSEKLRLLVVCHVYHRDEEEIRIISARKATRSETIYYGSRS